MVVSNDETWEGTPLSLTGSENVATMVDSPETLYKFVHAGLLFMGQLSHNGYTGASRIFADAAKEWRKFASPADLETLPSLGAPIGPRARKALRGRRGRSPWRDAGKRGTSPTREAGTGTAALAKWLTKVLIKRFGASKKDLVNIAGRVQVAAIQAARATPRRIFKSVQSWWRLSLKAAGIASFAAVPLILGPAAIGVASQGFQFGKALPWIGLAIAVYSVVRK